jgi:hypothetical protein
MKPPKTIKASTCLGRQSQNNFTTRYKKVQSRFQLWNLKEDNLQRRKNRLQFLTKLWSICLPFWLNWPKKFVSFFKRMINLGYKKLSRFSWWHRRLDVLICIGSKTYSSTNAWILDMKMTSICQYSIHYPAPKIHPFNSSKSLKSQAIELTTLKRSKFYPNCSIS